MSTNLSGAALLLSDYFQLSLLAKASLILIGGLAITALARQARAAVRHLVIATAFAGLVALPALIAFVPAMAIDVPVAPARLSPPPPSRPITANRGVFDTITTAARGDAPDFSI